LSRPPPAQYPPQHTVGEASGSKPKLRPPPKREKGGPSLFIPKKVRLVLTYLSAKLIGCLETCSGRELRSTASKTTALNYLRNLDWHCIDIGIRIYRRFNLYGLLQINQSYICIPSIYKSQRIGVYWGKLPSLPKFRDDHHYSLPVLHRLGECA
jgi:hypothetical protein